MKPKSRDRASLKNMNRRDFMRAGAAVGAATGALLAGRAAYGAIPDGLGPAPELPLAAPPIENVRIGMVGVGNMGTSHVGNLLKIDGCQITAVCDIVEAKVDAVQKMVQDAGFPQPAGYTRGETDVYKRQDLNMIDDGGQHAPRDAAAFAEKLLANGAPEDVALAVKVLDATLACQEMREGARHHGNFLWNREDEAIGDLNSVEFVLRYMIPMMIRHGDRLPADSRERVMGGIEAGLEEIRRMDVAVTYTNIAAMDCANSCLGGELTGDAAIAARGYEKLKALTDLTAQYGTVYEFYSPGYTQVTVDALHRLASLTTDEPTRIRARTMIARLALTTALHVHNATGRLAGPFSRAYHDQVVGATEAESDVLRRCCLLYTSRCV